MSPVECINPGMVRSLSWSNSKTIPRSIRGSEVSKKNGRGSEQGGTGLVGGGPCRRGTLAKTNGTKWDENMKTSSIPILVTAAWKAVDRHHRLPVSFPQGEVVHVVHLVLGQRGAFVRSRPFDGPPQPM